jgi:hypothetical protein
MDNIADIVGDAKRTLVVWFRQNGILTCVFPRGLDTIAVDLSESSRSILRGELP